MDARVIAQVMRLRRRWRRRDRWTRQQLLAHQEQRQWAARDHAVRYSPFYRRHLKGYERAPLNEVPPVTKRDLMAHLDEVFAAGGISRQRLITWLDDAGRGDGSQVPYAGRWYAARTGGTSGTPGLFAWDRREWVQALTSYARGNDWAGIRAGVLHPLRTALVSSRDPTHASAVVGATLQSRFVPTVRQDAGDPIGEIALTIERFRPRLLVGYASAMRAVAEARLAGAMPGVRLDGVVSASEVLTPTAREVIQRAWGVPVIDVYAATETAGIASPCLQAIRHVYEDLLVCEPVDDDYRPVPTGQVGSQLLVTVLFARTIPLIRYVLDDRVAMGPPGCRCGRPHAVLLDLEGRSEDLLVLPAAGGGETVPVHPIVLHHALDTVAEGPWQVTWDGELLVVDIVNPDVDRTAVQRSLGLELSRRGVAAVHVAVRTVAAPRRSRLGKIKLVEDLTRSPPP